MIRPIKIKVFIFLVILIPIGFSQSGDAEFDRYYRLGITYFNVKNPTEKTDALAVNYLERALKYQIVNQQQAVKAHDAQKKIGVIHQSNARYEQAIQAYEKSLTEVRKFKVADSVVFEANLFLGMVNYYTEDFLQSIKYLTEAERIYHSSPNKAVGLSLFNTLGVLYFETGDYRLSIKYFQKAQSLDVSKELQNPALMSNIASAYRNLGQNQNAIGLYEEALALTQDNPGKGVVLLNLAASYIDLKENKKARERLLSAYKLIDDRNKIVYYNLFGTIEKNEGNIPLAKKMLQESLVWNQLRSSDEKNPKNTETGITYKLMGEIALAEKKEHLALQYFQKAIFQFSAEEETKDVFKNPSVFKQNLKNIQLFEVLEDKAICLQEMFLKKTSSKVLFKATLDAFEANDRLCQELMQQFENEESRLLLTSKLYPFYSHYIDLLFLGHRLYPTEKLDEKAFIVAEKSKSAVLSLNLNETSAAVKKLVPDSLIAQEKALNLTKSRLSLKQDSSSKKMNQAKLADIEVKLSRVKNKIKQLLDNQLYSLKKEWSFEQLQDDFLDEKTSLISFFKTKKSLLMFVITAKDFEMIELKNHLAISKNIDVLNDKFKLGLTGGKYDGKKEERLLFDDIFSAITERIKRTPKLIIIPHEETTRLVFEVLRDPSDKTLLESHAITYQYSTDILLNSRRVQPKANQMLLVAPFANAANADALMASKKEAEALDGQKLMDAQATKNTFLKAYPHNSIVHLASHAVADNSDADGSYIRLFPEQRDSLTSRLYVQEIKNLDFSGVDLVFLNACETSEGRSISGEGVMNLCRAISFAGCPSTVTSMWKAEDASTAYVSIKFYGFLGQGNSPDEALRKAKLALLADPKMRQFRSPSFWAHLVLVGVPAESKNWWLETSIGLLVLAGLGYLLFRNKSFVHERVS